MPHRLALGDLVVHAVPEVGGGIAWFSCAGRPVFARTAAGPLPVRDAGDLACFPLVPYSNRIAHGRLPTPRGEALLAPLPGYAPHPLHGLGWQRAWEVAAASADALAMTHAHRADAHWPFDYRARQTLVIADGTLTIGIELRNTGDTAMPAGIGIHPFFPATPRATLTTTLAHVWRADADVLPTHREPLPAALDFAAARPLEGTGLDNCFGGWSRHATLAWPELGTTLAIEASATLGTLVVYTPAARDFFCVEPVSHLNNGFQLAAAGVPDTGVQLLAPGATLAGEVRFTPRLA
jgi:aldose 1-epimerase